MDFIPSTEQGARTDDLSLPSMPVRPSNAVQLALDYARRGFYVFPVNASNKGPLTANGSKDGTLDEGLIRQWWTRWPHAMIGADCGRSNIVAFDFDLYRGPEAKASLVRFQCEYDEFADAPAAKTPSGGYHFYFAAPDSVRVGRSQSKVAKFVDVLGQGSCVLPGSVRDDGRAYTWIHGCGIDSALPAISQELLKRLQAPQRTVNAAPVVFPPHSIHDSIPPYLAPQIRPRDPSEGSKTHIAVMFKFADHFKAHCGATETGLERYVSVLKTLVSISPALDDRSRSKSKENPIKKELRRMDIWKSACSKPQWQLHDESSTDAPGDVLQAYRRLADHVLRVIPLKINCFEHAYSQLAEAMNLRDPKAAHRMMQRMVKNDLIVLHFAGHKRQPRTAGWNGIGNHGASAVWGLVGKGQTIDDVTETASRTDLYKRRQAKSAMLQTAK